MSRLCLCVTLAATSLLATVDVDAAVPKQGWSLAKASAYIELRLKLTDPDVIDQARSYLRLQRQIGAPTGIAVASDYLRIANAGLAVDRASCLGIRPAQGGYVSFRCKLILSDDLGFTARATGVWKRLPTGKWDWFVASYVRGGYGPSEWVPIVRG